MVETDDIYPSIARLTARRTSRQWLLFGLTLFTCLLVFGGMIAVLLAAPHSNDVLILLPGIFILVLFAIPVAIWNNPVNGIYILFASAMLFPGIPTPWQPTVPTSFVPFWWNLSTAGGIFNTKALSGLPFSPAEVVMVYTTLCWLIRTAVTRQVHIERGLFFWAILGYIVTVGMGFLNGVVNHGDVTIALYEVRAQAQFFLMYLLGVNLLTDRKQLPPLLWLVVGGVGFQSICGVITYFVLSGSNRLTEQGVLGHDDSLLLNVLIFVFLLVSFARANRKLAWFGLAFMPTALFAVLANQRRAGIAALVVALLPLLAILWVMFADRRRQLRGLIAGLVLFNIVYLPVAWNADGIWALPARAIRSQTSPSERDASSDQYRESENTDLKYTRDSSPIYGYGYGRKFIQIVPLPVLTTEFLQYLPHNSVLWVWMRLGHIGFFVFMMIFATVFIRGLQMLRDKIHDPLLKVMGILAVLDALMVFTYGKFDLQLTNPRQMVITGMLLGIFAKLPALQARLDAPEQEYTLDRLAEESEDEENELALPATARLLP